VIFAPKQRTTDFAKKREKILLFGTEI